MSAARRRAAAIATLRAMLAENTRCKRLGRRFLRDHEVMAIITALAALERRPV